MNDFFRHTLIKCHRKEIRQCVMVFSLFMIFFSGSAISNSVDNIKISSTQSKFDKRAIYKNEIIKRAMEITKKEFGPYEFEVKDILMNRARSLQAIVEGNLINVYIAPSEKAWNEQTFVIKVPLRLGLLSYRILILHKDDLEKFSKVNSADDLKKITAGLRTGWVTANIFKDQNFKLEESQNYDGLFYLLDSHRVSYIPRTIYEVFDELEVRRKLLSNVVIEPRLALHIPTSTYIYVSPKEPRLAKRLEKGMNQMYESGELTNIIERYYADDIKRANLKNRKLIHIDNPFYSEEDQKRDEKYWYKL